MALWISLLFVSFDANAIVGGSVVSSTDPIAQVTVQIFNSAHDDDCSGIKVAPHFVLTAAHCRSLAEEVHTPVGKTYTVTNGTTHAKWRPNTRDTYDFAIVRVSDAMPGPFAKVADKNSMPKKGAPIFLAGYGEDVPGRESSNVLHKVQLKLDNPQFSSSGALVEGHGKGACAGDSGGPAYQIVNGEVVVWGVDSADKPGARRLCRDGEIYVKTAVAHDWIVQSIRETEAPNATASVAGAPSDASR